MRKLLFIFSLFFTQFAWGHAYYFAFAEMEFNDDESRFEIAVRATGHDVEDYMDHIGQPVGQLEKAADNPVAMSNLEEMIRKHFVIYASSKSLMLDLVGVEVNNKDEVIFYLTSRKMKRPDEIEIKFDLLMDLYEEQQNKITFFTNEEKVYLSFMQHKKVRTFEFNEYE